MAKPRHSTTDDLSYLSLHTRPVAESPLAHGGNIPPVRHGYHPRTRRTAHAIPASHQWKPDPGRISQEYRRHELHATKSGLDCQGHISTDFEEQYLPALVIEKFNGDPMWYRSFARQFEILLSTKRDGDDVRLVYLIEHCEPKARNKISHLISYPPEIGYQSAWRILHDEYGQPHQIARRCEELLRSAPMIGEHDPEGLNKMSVLMDRCCACLEDTDQSTSVDSMEVMLSVIFKLPPLLQAKWVKRSADIEHRTGSRAKFTDLSAFISKLSKRYNSIFGQAIFGKPSTA